MIRDSTTRQYTDSEALLGPAAANASASEPFRIIPSGAGRARELQEAQVQIITTVHPEFNFCPQKHFFCGIAQKLGCNYCAGK